MRIGLLESAEVRESLSAHQAKNARLQFPRACLSADQSQDPDILGAYCAKSKSGRSELDSTDPDSLDGQRNFENVRSPKSEAEMSKSGSLGLLPGPELQFRPNHLSDTHFSSRSFCMFPRLLIPRAAITRSNIIVGALFAYRPTRLPLGFNTFMQ